VSIHAKFKSWGNVGRFCLDRVTDYGELLELEDDRCYVATNGADVVVLDASNLAFSASGAHSRNCGG
jgi:hypothetical protein